MIDTLNLAQVILREQSDRAFALFQLIVWIRSNRDDPAHEAEADAIEDFVLSQTEDFAKYKDAQKKSLLIQLVQATSAGS